MSAFRGPQVKGAMQQRRKDKRAEAVERNARTKPERRSTKRQSGKGRAA